MAILPLLNPSSSEEWVQFIGKYILNMCAIEMISKSSIANLNCTDQVKIYKGTLFQRLTYLRESYPVRDREKFKKAMNFFDVLDLHRKYRNIIAHSGIMSTDLSSNEKEILGLINLEPNDKNNIAEIFLLKK